VSKLAAAGVVLLLAVAFVGCSTDEVAQSTAQSASTAAPPYDDYPMFTRWTELTETQRDTVCEQVLKRGGPDRSGATSALTETGLERREAQDMYPYVVNQCLSRGL
jgi:hypothetical protein